VVAHEEEGAIAIALLDPRETFVSDDVGCVAFFAMAAVWCDELGVVVFLRDNVGQALIGKQTWVDLLLARERPPSNRIHLAHSSRPLQDAISPPWQSDIYSDQFVDAWRHLACAY
jgi:hypothetical protein